MEEISTCLHRFLDPIYIEHAPEGCGNCALCINDEGNKECSQYTPVLVSLPHMKLPKWI